ncbi:MAG: ATP synthase F1 subunit gamma [Dysgonamonadaceae bacterium]|nr:ATP synthase F1 subunit gamma [Dysgonamonadaceae bacterium]MDD4727781.1 ATP synthase F1 subunit gamma [Dysgonamonadaceae bacterium]
MASLRDIKTQIHSVKSTQQITSAMQMVSTVKLQRAQKKIEHFIPYQQKITELLIRFLSSEESNPSVYEEKREVKKVAIVAFSSNMSLCGGFNANVSKKLIKTTQEYEHLGKENILIYAVGKKIAQTVKKLGLAPEEVLNEIANNPNYDEVVVLADKLMNRFRAGEFDEVILIYHHFKTKGSQILLQKTLLPISFDSLIVENQNEQIDYIVEPDKATILKELIPKVIRLELYSALLESHTSEHAARSIAMQAATDNADDILDDLSLLYNKSRQQSITNELLDIIGATFK